MKVEQFSPRKDFLVPGFFVPKELEQFIEEKMVSVLQYSYLFYRLLLIVPMFQQILLRYVLFSRTPLRLHYQWLSLSPPKHNSLLSMKCHKKITLESEQKCIGTLYCVR